MDILKISDTLGMVHDVPFPTSLSEVPLAHKIAYDVCIEDITVWIKDSVDNDRDDSTYYLYLLARAISEFLSYDINTILRIDVSQLIDSDGRLLPNVLEAHLQSLKKGDDDIVLDNESAESMLLYLHRRIQTLCDSYTFDFATAADHTFELAGETWTIPHVTRQAFTGQKLFSKITTTQAVELLEIKKRLHTKAKETRQVSDSQDLQNLRYSAFLRKVALLSRSDKEDPTPLDGAKLEEALQVRERKLATIDTKKAYDIVFFLIGIISI